MSYDKKADFLKYQELIRFQDVYRQWRFSIAIYRLF